MKEFFRIIATKISKVTGSVWGFVGAISFIIGWALSGPFFGYSNTWQLMINTFTTVVTFLMVFLIQNTQNRDTRALHIKLDELLRSVSKARNELVDIEDVSDEVLDGLHEEFAELQASEVKKKGHNSSIVKAEKSQKEKKAQKQNEKKAASPAAH